MKKNNRILIITIVSLLVLPFIFYVGQFLFEKKFSGVEEPGKSTMQKPINIAEAPFPVQYKHISTEINKLKQEIFLLEFDPKDKRICFKPALSFDSIFGFEKISEIVEREEAYAAVNAGFFYEFGDPIGMVAIDGKVSSAATGNYPIFINDSAGARFEQFKSKLYFRVKETEISIDLLNRTGKAGEVVLYTNEYGTSNRAKIKNTSLIIQDNTVIAVIKDTIEVKIPKNSNLISFYGKQASIVDKLGIKVGEKISIDMGLSHKDRTNIGKTNIDKTNIDKTNIDKTNIDKTNIGKTNIGKTNIGKTNIYKTNIDRTNIEKTSVDSSLDKRYNAYECGSWLIKAGKVIALEHDSWVGVLTNNDPRTAIGIKENGNVILMVVDGRQPNYSAGMTAKQLAQYLLQIGVKDAAMLDGGASSQIFVDGELKNKPSHKGIERPVAGAFIIKLQE